MTLDAHENLPVILIVEDDHRDVELLREQIRNAQIMNPLRVVRDGVKAAEYLQGCRPFDNRDTYPLPGIILLDLSLPKMDGFEVLAWIRAREQFNSIPVIVLTGHNDEAAIERAMDRGADAFLVKEVDTKGLLCLLQNASFGGTLWAERSGPYAFAAA